MTPLEYQVIIGALSLVCGGLVALVYRQAKELRAEREQAVFVLEESERLAREFERQQDDGR